MQISINNELVRKLIDYNHFTIDTTEMDIYLIAIRGAVPSDSESWRDFHTTIDLDLCNIDYDHYNCTIIQVRDCKLSPFRATTLPGKHYVKNPSHSMGVARVLEGHHVFRQGNHHENDVNKRYAAFRQHGTLPLLRDSNRNMKFDWDSDCLSFVKNTGLNLHYGKGATIGKWSAGCQVIKTDNDLKQWAEFKNRIYTGTPDKNKTYSYFLFDSEYIRSVILSAKSKPERFHRLLWGSKGEKVVRLQNRLLELGFDIGSADGDYGPKTMEKGVIGYQRKFIDPKKSDGIVTFDLWNAIFK